MGRSENGVALNLLINPHFPCEKGAFGAVPCSDTAILPTGKRLHSYGTSPSSIGKSTN